ncbi:hypothetical protein ABT096_25690 [Streptomyces sp. NPDC002561]|uniref:hypothetical protein n=1 Tax=Streptomyces sp. NPDC002561 TaxID=3154418 RepID=UPI00332341C1
MRTVAVRTGPLAVPHTHPPRRYPKEHLHHPTATGSPFRQSAQKTQTEEAVTKQVRTVPAGKEKPKNTMKKTAEETTDPIKH